MGRQILLIDDSAMLRRIATNVLHAQPARYEVAAATRASEGFARACGGETALILVGEHLAGAGDADVCRRLRDEPRTAEIPVVLLTGRHGAGSKLNALSENVVEVLRKPFAPEQLASLVNTIAAFLKKKLSLVEMRRALHPDASALEIEPYIDGQPPANDRRETAALLQEGSRSYGSMEATIRGATGDAVASGQTGVLRFTPASGFPTEVFVDGGRIIVVATRDGAAYCRAAAELLADRLSPATLQEAAEDQTRTSIPFLLTLGARGLLSKAAAVALLSRFGQRHFARLWMLPAKSLSIEFEPLDALPGFALRLEPTRDSVDEWLLGTLRVLTAADLVLETRRPGSVGTPGFQRRGELILKELALNDDEQKFIRRVNGRDDLGAIARSLGLTSEHAFLLLHRFRCLEVLECRSAPLKFVVTPRTNRPRVLPLKR